MALALVNTNRMRPPIAPLGVEYVAEACAAAGIAVHVLDLCLADDPDQALVDFFGEHRPDLVGLSFRNVDDCFWPSGTSFVPVLLRDVATIRRLSDAPIVLGGVGLSFFARTLAERSGVAFAIRGDGEQALIALHEQVCGRRRFDRVPGLLWRGDGAVRAGAPAWPASIALAAPRRAVDNATYYRLGGQVGLETKRGCGRRCAYCAEPTAKGPRPRLRAPRAVADEVDALLAQGVDVLHLCDSEFNLPIDHARAVCAQLIDRSLGGRVRWYAYLSVTPFDADLAALMARAGCAGINFTGDSAHAAMLRTYRQPHGRDDLARVVQLCRASGMAVMIDLLLGGPGETPESVAETIGFMKRIDPDCVGASLGVRLYPDTPLLATVTAEGPLEVNPSVHRRGGGPVDLLEPTFYVASALGPAPAALVRELIGGDPRFFEPADPDASVARDHNYNENRQLVDAIAAGARGAYWDILRRLRR